MASLFNVVRAAAADPQVRGAVRAGLRLGQAVLQNSAGEVTSGWRPPGEVTRQDIVRKQRFEDPMMMARVMGTAERLFLPRAGINVGTDDRPVYDVWIGGTADKMSRFEEETSGWLHPSTWTDVRRGRAQGSAR
jgi:hypothetical protein